MLSFSSGWLTPPLWHPDAVGGIYPINALRHPSETAFHVLNTPVIAVRYSLASRFCIAASKALMLP